MTAAVQSVSPALAEHPAVCLPDATAPQRSPRDGRSQPGDLAERVGWAVVAMFAAFLGLQVWTASLSVPGANLVAVALIAGGLLGVGTACRRPISRPVQAALLAGLAVGICYQAALTWLFDSAYGTDAAAFEQYAAALTLRGLNPYTHSMAPSLAQFHVPAIYHTYRLDGSSVDSVSYPAGAFLAYVPLLAAGVTTQAANIVDLFFWLAGMFVLWRLLPREIAWVAGLAGAAVVYVGFVIGGLTDALYIPFVLVAVYRWDRFAARNGTWQRWLGPVALGVAVSTKQTPWFLLPYLLLGLWFESRAAGRRPVRTLLSYASVVLGMFALFNGAFVVADPAAWLRNTLVPFLDPTIPDGQGLVNLTLFEHLGGGRLALFTVLGLAFMALSLAAFTLRYQSLKRAWVPLVALTFFLPTRSFASYLFMLLPTAIVAATSVAPAAGNPFPWLSRHSRPLLGGLAGAVVAVAALTFSSSSPLQISVVDTRSTGQLETLDMVTVTVRNTTGRALRPHFTVNASGHATTFWYAMRDGRLDEPLVPPHQVVSMELHAPNTASMPGVNAPLVVEAFTSAPATVSVSSRYSVSPVVTRIVPDAIDKPVPVGQPLALTVQLETQYGTPIKRAGVPVTLVQTVYGQENYYPGESRINGEPEGKSPVTVRTDAEGRARYTIVGVQGQDKPVSYQSWVVQPNGVPHGYSNKVSIQFVGGPRP